MTVRFTEGAAQQLEAAIDYIAERNPAAANLVRSRITHALERLELFPASGSPTDEAGIRYVPVRKTGYLLFYDLDVHGARIVRVRHASRSPLQRR